MEWTYTSFEIFGVVASLIMLGVIFFYRPKKRKNSELS